MKRFLLFVCPCYYANGGWLDMRGQWHIVDVTTGEIVQRYDR